MLLLIVSTIGQESRRDYFYFSGASVCVRASGSVSELGELKKPFDAMVSGARSFSRISVAITNDERHQCELRFRIPLADPSGIVRSIISVFVEHNCDEFQETRTDKSVNKDGKY